MAYDLLQMGEVPDEYGPHDRWLASALKQMFKRPCECTEAFEQLILGTATMAKQISGHFIFHRMQRPIVALSSKDQRE
eukprot:scaffold83214_cov124-Phaeocystis_antarctica.AAC.1